MKKTIVLFALLTFTAGAFALSWDYKLEEREAFHHTFAGDANLDADGVNGSITVIGDDVSTIQVDGEKIIRAADAEQMARAKKEVTLEMTESGGTAKLYVNGPFRSGGGYHEHDTHYEVTYNFTIRAPRAVAVKLKSVNGALDVRDTAGAFDVHTVNGKVKVSGVAGAGRAETVNGGIEVLFRQNPKSASAFKTVNGAINASFPANLAADLKLKTMNGGAYTDFDPTMPAGQLGGRGHETTARVGGGGTELRFETLNGSIKIHKVTGDSK